MVWLVEDLDTAIRGSATSLKGGRVDIGYFALRVASRSCPLPGTAYIFVVLAYSRSISDRCKLTECLPPKTETYSNKVYNSCFFFFFQRVKIFSSLQRKQVISNLFVRPH